MEENKIKSIDEYILTYSPDIQEILIKLRRIIKEAAPEAEEKISWGMPTFVLHGNLVHFAVCKNHIGFYPGSSGVETFMEELSEYKSTKGSIHLPLNNPLPSELISKIVRFRVAENKRDAEAKLLKKKKLKE